MGKRWTVKDVERLQGMGYVITSVDHPGAGQQDLPKKECKQVQWMWKQLGWWCKAADIQVEREYRFHSKRRWRLDFALPAYKIGIEYEGIFSDKSRHTTATGYTGDTEKYNAAQAAGWKVLRFTAMNYETFLTELKNTIDGTKSDDDQQNIS